MLEQQNADCSQYGVTCEELVKKLNPHLFSAPAGKGYSGTVQATLPVAGVETRLTFDAESGLDAETLRRLPDEQKTLKERPTGAAPPDIRQEAVYDAKWDQRLQTVSPASEGIDALSPNIMSSGAVKFETSHEENDPVDDAGDALAEYSHLLELIGYPYHDETEIPDILKAPVSVAVFDTWVDTSHCDLGANIEPIEITAGGAVREPAPHCGDMLPAPNVIDDHGTHVVGIIAAAANDVGVLGLNPFAKVMLVQVDKSRLRVPDYREHLSDLLVQLYFGKEMKVVNMSWRYTNQTGEVDTIREKIEGLRYNTLIVAAAGNEKVDFNAGGCGELPACLVGVDNIMTVVGLSRDGDGSTLWSENGEGSNTSADFHIAAIAEDVVSTVYGGYLGMMSGTSQAAPQVSAAASLLYAIHESVHRVDEPFLPPQRVKNRLMYTADLIPTLLDKVKSGRLNVRRALEVGRTMTWEEHREALAIAKTRVVIQCMSAT